jgi:hypothetical protein
MECNDMEYPLLLKTAGHEEPVFAESDDDGFLSRLACTASSHSFLRAGTGRRFVSLRHDADARCDADARFQGIPMLEIAENGAASIDLWCASARAQAVVADNSISISPGDLQNAQCEPDRQSRDAELLAALAQVTNWRRNGEVVELLGATPLRFRLMTN